MLACIVYRSQQTPPFVVYGGVLFRALSVAEGRSLRAGLSAYAAARKLRREGVRCAVFPTDYPYRALFSRYGVEAPSPVPLYRATAAGIVRRYLVQRGVAPNAATVALCAESVTPELRACAESLCADVRYLMLSVPRGGEALARELRRRFGVAAQAGALDALPRPDLAVSFDGMSVGGGALSLDGALGVAYDSRHSNELLAALYLAGALEASELRVVSVTPAADG